MKPRDGNLATNIGGVPFTWKDPLDAPLHDIPGETSRSMQRKGWLDRVALSKRQRLVQAHGWRRHKVVTEGCLTCGVMIDWFASNIFRKTKTIEELFS